MSAKTGFPLLFCVLGLLAFQPRAYAVSTACRVEFEEGQLASDPENRIAHYSNAISACTEPEDQDLLSTSYYNRGVRYLNKGDLDRAEPDLQMSLQTDPVGSNAPQVQELLKQIARRRSQASGASAGAGGSSAGPPRASRMSVGVSTPKAERFQKLEIECDGKASMGETFLCRVRSSMACRFTKIPFPKSADYKVIRRKRLTIQGKGFAAVPDDDTDSAVYFYEWTLKPLGPGIVTIPEIRMRCGEWSGSTEETRVYVRGGD